MSITSMRPPLTEPVRSGFYLQNQDLPLELPMERRDTPPKSIGYLSVLVDFTAERVSKNISDLRYLSAFFIYLALTATLQTSFSSFAPVAEKNEVLSLIFIFILQQFQSNVCRILIETNLRSDMNISFSWNIFHEI